MSADDQSSSSKRSRSRQLVRACAGLLLLAATVIACTPRSQPRGPGGEAAPKKSVDEWRKEYPLVALGDRLDYEARRTPGQTPPKLSGEAGKEVESAERMGHRVSMRSESLKLLHSQEA